MDKKWCISNKVTEVNKIWRMNFIAEFDVPKDLFVKKKKTLKHFIILGYQPMPIWYKFLFFKIYIKTWEVR